MPTPDLETRVANAKRSIRARSFDGIERRTVPATVELRTATDGAFRVVGHAAVFNDWSEDLGGFIERIQGGAFDEVLAKNPDVRALVNHDPNLVLARTTVTNGPGRFDRLETDAIGLVYDFTPTDTTYARDLEQNLLAKVVTQSSFAFRVAAGNSVWEYDEEQDLLLRTIIKFSDLFDVSPVTYPAYPTADAGARTSPVVDNDDTRTTSQTEEERDASADAQEQGELASSGTERAEDTHAWRTRARAREQRLRTRADRL